MLDYLLFYVFIFILHFVLRVVGNGNNTPEYIWGVRAPYPNSLRTGLYS